jgi:hypothetical protein
MWVKLRGGPDHLGRISSIPEPVVLENIESTVTASTFRIDLSSGDVVETTGVNILRIDHGQYQKESASKRYEP